MDSLPMGSDMLRATFTGEAIAEASGIGVASGFGITEDGAIGTEILRGCISIEDGGATPALAKAVSTGAEMGALGLIGTVMLPWTGALVWTTSPGRTAGVATTLTAPIMFNLGGSWLLGSGTV
jgi:hypothetical protein